MASVSRLSVELSLSGRPLSRIVHLARLFVCLSVCPIRRERSRSTSVTGAFIPWLACNNIVLNIQCSYFIIVVKSVFERIQ